MKILRLIKKLLGIPFRIFPLALRPGYLVKILKAKIPLGEVRDYEGYWQMREKDNFKGTLKRAYLLAGIIKGGYTLLDIGCGDGDFLDFFKKKELL